MPNQQDKGDAELSVLLSKAEPPKSPQHVDDDILAYASARAADTGPGSQQQFLSVSKNWLNQNWLSAVATISVAVIAVSLTFQNFLPPAVDEIALTAEAGFGVVEIDADLENSDSAVVQSSQALLLVDALTVEEASVAQELADLPPTLQIDNINLAVEPQAGRVNEIPASENRQRLANPVNTSPVTVPAQSAATVSSLERTAEPASPNDLNLKIESSSAASLDQDDNAIAAITLINPSRRLALNNDGNFVAGGRRDELRQAQTPQPASTARPSTALREDVADVVEEVVRAGNFAQLRADGGASASAVVSPSLDTLLSAGAAAQQDFIEMLTAVLIDSDQNAFELDAEFPFSVAVLISTYNQLENASSIEAMANRYRQERLGFTAFNLPESLAQLMDFLRALEIPGLQ